MICVHDHAKFGGPLILSTDHHLSAAVEILQRGILPTGVETRFFTAQDVPDNNRMLRSQSLLQFLLFSAPSPSRDTLVNFSTLLSQGADPARCFEHHQACASRLAGGFFPSDLTGVMAERARLVISSLSANALVTTRPPLFISKMFTAVPESSPFGAELERTAVAIFEATLSRATQLGLSQGQISLLFYKSRSILHDLMQLAIWCPFTATAKFILARPDLFSLHVRNAFDETPFRRGRNASLTLALMTECGLSLLPTLNAPVSLLCAVASTSLAKES